MCIHTHMKNSSKAFLQTSLCSLTSAYSQIYVVETRLEVHTLHKTQDAEDAQYASILRSEYTLDLESNLKILFRARFIYEASL